MIKQQLNQEFNLDATRLYTNSRILQKIITSICSNPGKVLNPFYFYGGNKCDKTYMLQAIGNCITKHNPNLDVLFITPQECACDDCSEKSLLVVNDFNRFDVLLLDEIQFVCNSEITNNEILNVFKIFKENSKHIIITGSNAPKDIDSLDNRIVEFIEQGVIIDVDFIN